MVISIESAQAAAEVTRIIESIGGMKTAEENIGEAAKIS